MDKFITAFFTHIVAIVLCVSTASASTVGKPSILVIGDSLSAAYNMPPAAGWVSLLQKRLLENNLSFNVINASISGDTTASGVSRIDNALRHARPTLTIIELGANDGLRGLSLVEMRNNLGRMIATAQANDSKVLLLGVNLPPNYGPQYTGDFRNSYSLLADKHGVALVPSILKGFEDNPEYFLPDRVHPNRAAQDRILDNVWPAVTSLLK